MTKARASVTTYVSSHVVTTIPSWQRIVIPVKPELVEQREWITPPDFEQLPEPTPKAPEETFVENVIEDILM